MKLLVAYYSLSGYTRSLAEATTAASLAASDGAADVCLHEVVPAKPYTYFSAGVKGVTQAMAGTIIALAGSSPADDFDAVAVFSPTWGWMSSPPIRSFVAAMPEGRGRPAVVGVTHAGGPIGSFDRLAGLVEGRGYRVLDRLSVFCYDRGAIAAAAARTAELLVAEHA